MNTKENESEKIKTIKKNIEHATLRSELFSKIIKRYHRLIPLLAIIYTVVILMFFLLQNYSSFSLFKSRTDFDFSELTLQLQETEANFSSLEEGIKTILESPDNLLALRVTQLEENQESLIETISFDVDKAITARLLQEKQKVIEAEISRLSENQDAVNARIDTLITTLVAVPLIGFILSLLGIFISYLINRSK